MSDLKFKVILEGSAEFAAATKRLDDEVKKLGTGAGAAGKAAGGFGQELTSRLIPALQPRHSRRTQSRRAFAS